ncbi:MAG: HRDC domain-containing protein [Planctomycetota bacterium]
MSDRLITDQSEFEALCGRAVAAGRVGFDTEFVSEYTHRPQLCLLQFAIDGGDGEPEIVGVDPFEIDDLTPWWQVMADDDTLVVIHGGQAEIKFCLEEGGLRPRNTVDVQLAEGFRSSSYPLGYESLVSRVVGVRPSGKETRADWRRRPLTDSQIDYALDDASHLLPVWDRQRQSLADLGRLDWVLDELETYIDDLVADLAKPSWARISGMHRLRRREFAVATAIADWREAKAAALDRPARRVLRDDIVIDLAKRKPKSDAELTQTRDWQRTDAKRDPAGLVDAIAEAVAIPKDDLPRPPESDRPDLAADEQVVGQLLGIALASRCAEMKIARTLVGTNADLRHLVRHHLYEEDGPAPKLATGWRAEVCGTLLTDVMDGKLAIRVADPDSDHPLVFE